MSKAELWIGGKFVRLAAAFALLLPLGLSEGFSKMSNGSDFFLYVGTYGEGVFGYRFNSHDGSLKPLGLLAKIANPSFLAVDRGHRYLYAVSELNGGVNGGVAAFAIDRGSGSLQPLNSKSSEGQAPCYISVDKTGKMVFVANYGTGEVVTFPIDAAGKLGDTPQVISAQGSSVNPERQRGPHAHEAVPSADNRFLYVPDLGLDQIRIYKLNAAAQKLSTNDPPFAKLPPGNGPRHIALTPDGKFAYVVNELKSVVTVFARNRSTGALSQTQEVSTLPEGSTGDNAPAEILMDSAGKFVYASNRGPGSIAVFARTPDTGALKQVQVAAMGGTSPRGVGIEPTGRFLFAGDQKLNRFVLFEIDHASGTLKLTGKDFDVSSPVSFVFVPVNQ
jgi:6-phosphogluconolactonase